MQVFSFFFFGETEKGAQQSARDLRGGDDTPIGEERLPDGKSRRLVDDEVGDGELFGRGMWLCRGQAGPDGTKVGDPRSTRQSTEVVMSEAVARRQRIESSDWISMTRCGEGELFGRWIWLCQGHAGPDAMGRKLTKNESTQQPTKR